MVDPRVDPVGKISDIYTDGTREVPYLTFMHIFNDLLADPMNVVPREPSEELMGTFKAACMAVGVGVSDSEGRAEQRVKEFQENVFAVWKEKLSRKDFMQFEDILRGAALRKRKAEEKSRAGKTSLSGRTKKSSALLKRLRLIDADEALEGEGTTEPEKPGAAAPPAAQEPERFESMSAMCRSIRAGQVSCEFGPGDGRTLGHYAMGAHEVTVRLAEASGQNYVVLTVNVGYSSLAGGVEMMGVIAEAMGYVKMGESQFMRKDEDFVHTLKAQKEKASLASASANGVPGDVAAQLTRLHWDLGELLERMET